MKKIVDLFKKTWQEFAADKAPRLGAALAYYTIFSIAPLLLIAAAIAGMVFGKEAAQHQIIGQLRGLVGDSGAKAIEEMARSAATPKIGVVATIVGVVTLLFGAAGVFGELKDALNTIWNVEPKKSSGILGMVKDRFLSIAMVLGVGFLLLVSLIIDALISGIGDRLSGGQGEAVLWQSLQMLLSLGVVTVLLAAMFRFLPDVRVEWRDVWYGALFTSFLFVIGKFALGLYFAKSAVASSYGAAGSLVVVLIWIYCSAQIVFFGAEFTQVYSKTHGSRSLQPVAPKPGARATDEASGQGVPAQPAVVYRTAKASGGKGKLAAGAVLGLFVGVLAGLIASLVILFKQVRKLFTL
jgi:membrane protein